MWITRCFFLFLFILITTNTTYSQTFQSLMTFEESGTDFIPANPVELIDIYTNVSTLMSCFHRCHMDIRCRTFVSDLTLTLICRLYEGLINTGTIIRNSSSTSRVGGIHYNSLNYIYYNQACDPHSPAVDRYLICLNGSWDCLPTSYWNDSMCLNDVYYNNACNRSDLCRQDVGLQCDFFYQKCVCNSMAAWNGTSCESCIVDYGQCGGLGWSNRTSCCTGFTCTYINGSFSQCLQTTSEMTILNSTESLMTSISYANDSRENATTVRSWDCCKTSCGWPDKASVTSPVKTCAQDGNTTIDNNTQSVCSNGSAYICTNQQSWNVSNSLSYGYASANISGKNESDWCCACYSLLFTSAPINGKEMIVQVTNTNYNPDNSFGLQIPGGGWGGSPNGCSNQFNSTYSWGQQYGGISNRSECNSLPNVLQAGCYWRFDWFMNANNPTVSFKEVSCPSIQTNITGCIRM